MTVKDFIEEQKTEWERFNPVEEYSSIVEWEDALDVATQTIEAMAPAFVSLLNRLERLEMDWQRRDEYEMEMRERGVT